MKVSLHSSIYCIYNEKVSIKGEWILKKFMITGFMIIALAGCGEVKEADHAKKENTQQVMYDASEMKYSFPKQSDALHEGLVTVITPAGTSENGNIPTVFIKKDAIIQQVEIELSDFQEDKEIFLYVDEMFEDRHRVGKFTETTVSLKNETLEEGVHTVTAVQFENDDPSGQVISFAEAKFENKSA